MTIAQAFGSIASAQFVVTRQRATTAWPKLTDRLTSVKAAKPRAGPCRWA
jgi:hypothetical protein